MDPKSIGKKIQELRIEKKLSVEEMANLLNVTVSTVQKWESGVRIPRDEKKIKIAEVFEKNVSDIFFDQTNH